MQGVRILRRPFAELRTEQFRAYARDRRTCTSRRACAWSRRIEGERGVAGARAHEMRSKPNSLAISRCSSSTSSFLVAMSAAESAALCMRAHHMPSAALRAKSAGAAGCELSFKLRLLESDQTTLTAPQGSREISQTL